MHTHELTLGLAFGLGAVHALEPGHGKTAMLLYLAGERRSMLHPLVMGLSSALSHSVSLVVIAAIVHLTQHILTGDHHHGNETITNAMRWISSALILAVGFWMLWSAWRAKPTKCNCSSHRKQNEQSGVAGSSLKTSYSMSALLGAAFGLMPCPSAMAAYFSGLSSGSPVTSYIVVALFAAGIATSLTLVGFMIQLFGGRLTNMSSKYSHLPWPYLRAGLIIAVGVVYLCHVALNPTPHDCSGEATSFGNSSSIHIGCTH